MKNNKVYRGGGPFDGAGLTDWDGGPKWHILSIPGRETQAHRYERDAAGEWHYVGVVHAGPNGLFPDDDGLYTVAVHTAHGYLTYECGRRI